MRVAAIGIGSNSLRMLVADVDGGRLLRLDRYREGLRVFAALDRQGNIVADMIGKACQSVETFRRQAVAQGAEQIHLFATSAVRDAANQAAFSQALLEATGLSLEICSGALEAKLSFLGATDGESSGLIDIGGGSTEIVVGRGLEIQRAVSLQMGAVRLYRCHDSKRGGSPCRRPDCAGADRPRTSRLCRDPAPGMGRRGRNLYHHRRARPGDPLEPALAYPRLLTHAGESACRHGNPCSHAHGKAAGPSQPAAATCRYRRPWNRHFTCLHAGAGFARHYRE